MTPFYRGDSFGNLLKYHLFCAALLIPLAVIAQQPQAQSDLEKEVARSKAAAVALYPDANKPGSALDQAIRERIKWIQKNQPDLFQDATWPMKVTRNAAESVAAGQAQQPAMQQPRGGTMLDQRPGGQSISTSHGTMLDRDAGPKPKQLEDGTVVSLDQQIRRSLKDPDSVIYASWGELKIGQSPGGNPVWTVMVTYRAKNGYGAYMGNTTEVYYLKHGFWQLK